MTTEKAILLYEKYIAQLIGIDHEKLTFDFREDKLTVRELDKEFISLEDRNTLKNQTYENNMSKRHHQEMIERDI